MTKYVVPPDMYAVCVGGVQIVAVAGIIDTGDAETPEQARSMIEDVKAVIATDEQASAASDAATQQMQKADVVAQLRTLGIPFDGRAGLVVLQGMLVKALSQPTAPAAPPAV